MTTNNISTVSVIGNETRNTSSASKRSKKSILQLGSSFLHRIQSNTNFVGPRQFNVIIRLLDDLESVSGTFKKTATGQDVFDWVCKELNIVEKEYFGLRYNDKFRYWVDLSAPLSKTFKTSNIALSFRFRFYPSDLNSVKEEVTRYNLFIQLQRDLSHGRLQCHQNDSAELAALILQVEKGDYDQERHLPGYVSEFKLLLRQTERMEEHIAEFHKSFKGMSPELAMEEFLKKCSSLQTFGVNPYTVTIGKNPTNVVIGASSTRILVFVQNQIVYNVPWSFISGIDYSGKLLKLRLKPEFFTDYLAEHPELSPEVALSKVVGSTLFGDYFKPEKSDKKIQLKFTCPSSTFAKHLWRDLLSQEVFFNEDTAKAIKPIFSKPKIPLITRGSTFRCPTSRVMRELQKDTTPAREIEQHEFVRYSLPRQKSRPEAGGFNNTRIIPVPSINVESFSINLNDSGAGSPAEPPPSLATETSIEPEPALSIELHENYNQIHVESNENITPVELHNGDLVQAPVTGKPTHSVTVEVRNGTITDGKLTNGTTSTEKRPVTAPAKQTLGRQIVVGILDLLVLLLLFSIFVVAVFEVVDHNNQPNWFYPHVNNFRTKVYDPWRSYAIDRYNHLFY